MTAARTISVAAATVGRRPGGRDAVSDASSNLDTAFTLARPEVGSHPVPTGRLPGYYAPAKELAIW